MLHINGRLKKCTVIAILLVLVTAHTHSYAANNPFSDVPTGHWAYTMLSMLASRGVISGIANDTYDGRKPATRYEIASVLARVLSDVDVNKAEKSDIWMLEKLIKEFKEEMTALGVKLDGLHSRFAGMENSLGGWNISGTFHLDAKISKNNHENGWYRDGYTFDGQGAIDFNNVLFNFRKYINENTSFMASIKSAGDSVFFDQFYVRSVLPYDIVFTVGRQTYDKEAEFGLYADEDAWIGDWGMDALRFRKWLWGGRADVDFFAARYNDDADADWQNKGYFLSANLNFYPNENLRFGFIGNWHFADKKRSFFGDENWDVYTYGLHGGFSFIRGVELKGIYYWQRQGQAFGATMTREGGDGSENAKAWKAILEISQDTLKVSSLWLEYGQIDNNFLYNRIGIDDTFGLGDNYGARPYAWGGAEMLANQPFNNNTTKLFLVRAEQRWNDKWRTYLRYARADFDTPGQSDAVSRSIGVIHILNPSVVFELMYGDIDYGANNHFGSQRNGNDHIIRFRTTVTF